MHNAKWVFSGIFLLLINVEVFSQQLKLGKNPSIVEKSAVLELQSDNQGLLFPRLNDTVLINAMNVPDGMVIFHKPSLQLLLRSEGYWKPLTVSGALANYWSLNGNAGTTAAQFLGTTDLRHLYFRTNNIQAMILDSAGNIGVGASPLFTSGNREKLLVDAGNTSSYNVISGKGSIDNYLQLNIQNRSTGTSASSDLVATADNGTESVNYVDLGINSSGFTNATYPVLGGINNAYLYSTGNDFIIGNATASKNLRFFTGGYATTNERLRIDGNGNVGIGITSPTAYLHLKAGTTAAGTAPLKFTSGTLLTTAEAGGFEFLTDKFYGTITTGAVRKEFTLNESSLTAARIPFATTNGRLTDNALMTYSGTRLSPNYLTLAAGTATAGTAPLVMTSGVKLTTPQAGAVEFDGTHFYGTIGTTRFQLDQQAPNTTGTNTGDQTITLTGDVTGSGTGTFPATIGSNVVTYAKMQQVAAARLLGNPTGSLANASEISLGTGLSFVGSTLTYTPATSGTVTSVGLSLPSIFSVTNSPVTSSGTLTGTLNTQSANLIFAGPATGAAASPTFRSLASGDLPIATTTVVGAVSVGTGLSVTAGGVLTTTSAAPSGAAGGDLTGTYPNPSLATVNTNTGVFGSTTVVPQITVNGKGLITAVSPQTIAFPVTSVNTATGTVSLGITNMNDATITTPAANQVLQYNGTKWVNTTPSYISSAITSLNGLTASTQTFATPGTTGTAPAWSSTGSVHTLNIPLASAAGVTAGLLSNTDWNTFNNKLSTIDTTNISNFYIKVRSLHSAGPGIAYNSTTGVISNSGVLSLNGNTGALTMDTTYISNFALKTRSLFSGTAPITYSNGQIGITQATSTTNGYLSSTDWNTFNGKLGSVSSGNLTETGSSILTITGGTGAVLGSGTSLQVKQANGTQGGFLSSADWTTFNSKQSALTLGNVTGSDFGITGGTGAVVGSGLGLTLATVNTNTGSFGSTTVVPQITVNGKGLITAVSPQTIAFPVTSVNTATGAVSLGITNMNDATITTPAANQVLQYNGTKWVNTTPSYISSAITSLNGLTASTQTFATPGTTGTAPAWSSTGAVHTLNLPLASASGVTAGLLSNTDWNTFNNKLSTIDTTNISNFYLKVRSLHSAGPGIGYNSSTGVISNSGVLSLNGNTGALTMDTTYISNFALKTRSLFSGTAPITYSNGQIGITQASSTTNGYLSSADWNTFNSKLGSVSSGNLTETGSSILTITGGTGAVLGSGTTLQVKQANGTQSGFLSSADWTTFNGKQNALTLGNVTGGDFAITGGTGAVVGSGLGLTLATVNTNIGAFGSTTVVPQITVNGKGLITAVSPQTIAFPVTSVNSATGAVSLGIANMNDATITTPAANQVLQYNGTKWVNTTPSYISSAITSLNGLTASTQTFATPGTTGTAPAWSSTGSVHTLNIPLSSAASVTAGLLSNTDYSTFNNKVGSISLGGTVVDAATTFTVTAGAATGTRTLNTQIKNTIFSGPASGADATPTFRVLAPADLPVATTTLLGGVSVGSGLSVTAGGVLSATNTNAGTVTTVSATGTQGVTASVATPSTTPAITIGLGAITPTSVAATGTVSGSNLSGTNTGDQTITLTSDVTGTGTGSFATTIGANKVTYAKMQQVTAARLLGNPTGSLANAAEISLGTGLSFTGSTLNTNFGLTNLSATAPLVYNNTTGVFSLPKATTSTDGYLSATDWNTFNNKAGATNTWLINGNAGTSSATNFFGTTDAQDLVFKANNVERLRIVNGVSAATGTTGDVTLGDANSGTVRSNKEMIMRQDGDVYGPSALHLRNRNGENGAIFETLGATASLVDFIFKTGTTASPIVSNIRFETRAGNMKVAGNTTEWQLGQPDATNGGPTLVIGASGSGSASAFTIGNVGIGNTTPSEKLDITGNLKFSGALMPNNTAGTSGYLLTSAGAGAAPTWSNPSSLFGSSVWSLAGNSGTTSGSNFLGTTDLKSLVFRTNNTQGMFLDSLGNVGIGASPSFTSGSREKLLVDAGTTSSFNVISGKGTINNYLQLNIQNKSAGTAASSDVVATADNGDESNNYVDFGINGSGNTANYFGNANDAYLYNLGQNFLIGTGTASKSLVFLTGGGTQSTNERMRIDGSGNVGIGIAAPTNKLSILGTNPLYLSGVQTGLNTDSVLTITGGVVRKILASSLGSGSTGWSLTGNASTNPATNFLGTTDNQALVFKVNSAQIARMEQTSVALGTSASTNVSTNSLAFGNAAVLGYNISNAMAIGNSASANIANTFVIGNSAISNPTNGGNAFSIGNSSSVNSTNSFAIGPSATTAYSITDAVAIGYNATSNASNSIALGSNSTAASKTQTNGAGAIAFGNNNQSNSAGAVSIGQATSVGYSSTNSMALGSGATIGSAITSSTAVGTNASTTMSNTMILGDRSNSLFSVGIGSEAFATPTREKLMVDAGTSATNDYLSVIGGKGTSNNYLQINIQNKSAGNSASSDVVATNDGGTEQNLLNFIDMGINSSGNTSTGALGGANTAYLYGTGSDLSIGNSTSGKVMKLFTGGTADANERMRIDGSGNIGIANISPVEKLDVTGNIRFSGGLIPTTGAPLGTFLQSNGNGVAASWLNPTLALNAISWGVSGNNSMTTSNFLGTTDNVGLYLRTNNTHRMFIDNSGNVSIGTGTSSTTPPAFTASPNSEKLLVDAGTNASNNFVNVISGKANTNNYIQLNIQNRSAGTAASSDVVATNDAGNESVNYIDMGINSSGNTSTGVLGGANAAYLYGTGTDFAIGNSGTGVLKLFTGTTEDLRIDVSGNVGIGTTSPAQKLDVTGNANISGSIWVDGASANSGTTSPALLFGNSTTGESIASKRTSGGNQYGLDLYTNNTNRIAILQNGNVGMGTTTPAEKLVVSGNISTIGNVLPSATTTYNLGSATLRWNNVYTANLITISDRRLKTNILNSNYGLKEVLALQPVTYNWKSTPDKDKQLGLIAQDVKKVVPEAVSGDESKEDLGINYNKLVPVLINAIKEQQKQIEDLKQQILKLQNKN